jgi:type II secretion system GspH-like protein
VICACALIASIAGIALPALKATRDRDVARLAARHLAMEMQRLRFEALRRNAAVAIRFDPGDLGRMRLYVDGDRDGVLQRDVDAGVDPPIGRNTRLSDEFTGVALAIAHDVPDPEGSGTLIAGSDPVRIGSSNFVTFTPMATATSGTVYLAARHGPQVCVRILGATGRLRVLWFDTVTRTWRQD